ncbi:hypothetical protein V1264_015257 [Littorina saxatilis]|uniref:Uncharacterized protein n=1 Tax=Littorina saxatilis TaxID=31220 RepID=A0AAN9BLD1_9CAEN
MAHRLSVADDAGYNIQRHVAANNGQGGGAAGQDVDVHRDPQAAMDVDLHQVRQAHGYLLPVVRNLDPYYVQLGHGQQYVNANALGITVR